MNCGFVENAVLLPCPVAPNEAQGRSPSPHGVAFTEAFVGGASVETFATPHASLSTFA
jgi:hypothetical protein